VIGEQGSGIKDRVWRSPVKSATLVFFEEFNGASRSQKSEAGRQRTKGMRERGKSK
jgi:hypothetical protein